MLYLRLASLRKIIEWLWCNVSLIRITPLTCFPLLVCPSNSNTGPMQVTLCHEYWMAWYIFRPIEVLIANEADDKYGLWSFKVNQICSEQTNTFCIKSLRFHGFRSVTMIEKQMSWHRVTRLWPVMRFHKISHAAT